eukprot:TRINITY_DN4190_c0_g1_i1.p1 TRINITY_DN4190_c0_g1~~TRINITY_DN4190_c0_g1_i1.p1  ORF type:complete len:703 (+),score=212.29 TRINITY_DN4190_c0_g1_i1:2305-4413(+)
MQGNNNMRGPEEFHPTADADHDSDTESYSDDEDEKDEYSNESSENQTGLFVTMDVESLKRDFQKLWIQANGPVPISALKIDTKGTTEVLKSALKGGGTTAAFNRRSKHRPFKSLSHLPPIQKLPEVAPIRRVKSMEFKHSWDYMGYYWDEGWKTPKAKKKPANRVRFAEDTKDTKQAIETDMKEFGEIFYGSANEKSEGLVTVKNDVDVDVIIAGSVENLVSKLADAGIPDPNFVKEFLLSFRLIMGPIKLLTMLIERYDAQPPKDAPESDVKFFERYSQTIKLRVINVVKKWLQNHYYDFVEEKRLFNTLIKFIEEKVFRSLDSRWALQLLLLIQEKHPEPARIRGDSPVEMIEVTLRRPDQGFAFKRYTHKKLYYNMCFYGNELLRWLSWKLEMTVPSASDVAEKMMKAGLMWPLDPAVKVFDKDQVYRLSNRPMEASPKSLAPKNLNMDQPIKFLDIHPCEIARQLTLLGQWCYLRINAREMGELISANCIVKAYRCPWIDKTYLRAEEVIRWMTSEIVLSSNLSQRCEVVKRWILVAKHCYKYQNFADCKSILMAFRGQPVARLRKTWKTLGKKYKKIRETLEKSLQPGVLLETIRKCEPPFIPDVEIYINLLKDISKESDSYQGNDKMVNFVKLRHYSVIYEDLERNINSARYGFRTIPKYQDYICYDRTLLSPEDCVKYSKICEAEVHDDINRDDV